MGDIVRLRGTTLIGGEGAAGTCGFADGADGPGFDGSFPGSAPQILPGTARRFTTKSPVAVGDFLPLRFEGAAGDLVILHVAERASVGVWVDSALVGVHLGADALLTTFVFGALPPSGQLDVSLLMPPLAGTHVGFVAQPIFVDLAGAIYDVGPATTLVTQPGL